MPYTLKHIITASAMASSLALAHADVTIGAGSSYNGASLPTSSALTWSTSPSFIVTLNASASALQAQQPATVIQTTAYDPDLEEDVRITASVTAPISAVTVSETTNQITSIATSGGVTITAPKAAGVSLGGTLTIANLQIDLTGKRIYADITGNFTGAATGTAGSSGGAITTLSHFYLWNYVNASDDLSWQSNSQLTNLSFSQVIITQAGFNHLVSALRFQSTGKGVLSAVTDFGSLTTPVPEASSTWMLMGGLMTCAMWQARRRRTAQTDNTV